jgi:ATP-dependent Zn protease
MNITEPYIKHLLSTESCNNGNYITGADIKNVVNQAALRAAADMVEAVTMKHLEAARDKVLMG